ncbi:MAG: hypothetical protein QXJ84_02505 [Desulfurococcaceae archaeon]
MSFTRKKRFGRTLLTEEEVKVLDVLLRYNNVTVAAKMLGKSQPTVSIVKKKIEEKIDMAIETLKLAIEKGLVKIDDIADLVSSIEMYRKIKEKEKAIAETA